MAKQVEGEGRELTCCVWHVPFATRLKGWVSEGEVGSWLSFAVRGLLSFAVGG
eukprot:SAG31_NODE_817_length_11849_cov_6.737362_12_plen_53_part_00